MHSASSGGGGRLQVGPLSVPGCTPINPRKKTSPSGVNSSKKTRLGSYRVSRPDQLPADTMRPDRRPTLSRREARSVYDGFAVQGHIGGKDAESGYGGPAIQALLTMAAFSAATSVLEFGCGQGKLAELVLARESAIGQWRCVDQSPEMASRASERLRPFGDRATVVQLEDGDPSAVQVEPGSIDRFVSTYVLDLLSEEDMFAVLSTAERSLKPTGLLLLSGITYGYRLSLKTCFMTLVWELLYRFKRKTVGGCRPQLLQPYLESRGWKVISRVQTLPTGFPWMASEVICATPPP